jgi:sortase A
LRREDEIEVYSGDEVRTYRIERVVIVPEKYASEEQQAENARWIAPTSDERLTLVSCWPRNDNTHRIIVVARPASAG